MVEQEVVVSKEVCACCGKEYEPDELCEVIMLSGPAVKYCPDCVSDHTYVCEDCGRRFHYDCYSTEVFGRTVCDRCLDNNYAYCEECDRYVSDNYYNYDRNMCCRCYDERNSDDDDDEDTGVDEYHGSSGGSYIGESKRCWKDKWRGLGVELEIERDYRDCDVERQTVNELYQVCNHLNFEHDGSLENGFEIITDPHTVEAFQKINWQGILNVCKKNGYTSHNAGNCGLHVHISRNMFGYTEARQANAIAKLVAFFEYFWDDIVKVSRRQESQLNSYAARYEATEIKVFKDISKNMNLDRYKAINNTNRYTVEIRVMRGTLRLESFLACVDFCVCVSKNSRNIPWRNIKDAELWLKGLKAGTLEYIRAQGAFKGVL